MPAVTGQGRCFAVVSVLACLVGLAGCRAKATPSQCDQLLDRYAMLVVTEKYKDASAEDIQREQQKEKSEARERRRIQELQLRGEPARAPVRDEGGDGRRVREVPGVAPPLADHQLSQLPAADPS